MYLPRGLGRKQYIANNNLIFHFSRSKNVRFLSVKLNFITLKIMPIILSLSG